MSKTITAKDLRIGDIGRTARSLVYPNKHKKGKPVVSEERNPDGTIRYVHAPKTYTITSLYGHENGTILINGGGQYLRPDTEVEFL